jgi:hypothetical protein
MVLIGGMPALRMGDMTTCAGPPDVVALGCPTVLIGEGGAGAASGGGPPGAGSGAVVAAHMSSAMAQTDNNESSTKEEHWIEFQFVDKAGNPVSGVHYKFTDPDGNESHGVLRMDGTIRRDGISEGQCEVVLMSVHNAKWSKESARAGDEVKLSAEVLGYEDGTKAQFKIWEQDIKGPDDPITEIETIVQGGKVEADWKYEYHEDEEKEYADQGLNKGYSSPEYYFVVHVGEDKARSGLLEYKDWIEIELKDEDKNPIVDEEYILYLSDGSVRKGKLNGDGYVREEKIPPGKCNVRFPNR